MRLTSGSFLELSTFILDIAFCATYLLPYSFQLLGSFVFFRVCLDQLTTEDCSYWAKIDFFDRMKKAVLRNSYRIKKAVISFNALIDFVKFLLLTLDHIILI